ncbi:GGDEF domain-containing protein [Shewanella atlantica]|uniref:diguanylate cyclase n=1 Tax=Shewanella atlantica TaxID=271099 RepID=A0A3S0IDY6_9GAMM|nr:GGDEF domain-containing protein [Shewanella atlantica]RTR33356.1 GGDEF domain-containing protein [Shewanella atlantica]
MSLFFTFTIFRSAIFRVGLPIVVVASLCLYCDNILAIVSPHSELMQISPYIMLPLVIFLSQPFNQGNSGLLAVVMLLGYYLIQNHLTFPLIAEVDKLSSWLIIIGLQLSLFVIHLLPERRLLSKSGVNFLLLLTLQLIIGFIAIKAISAAEIDLLWRTYLKPIEALSSSPYLLLMFSVLLTVTSFFVVVFRNDSSDHIVFTNLLFSTLCLYSFNTPVIPELCFSLAATFMLVHIMTSSHELAFVDQLTELPGRRALEIELKHLSGLYTIAMVDIDHFKHFNDNYGHRTGDEVLRLVSLLMSKVSGRAKIYRYGGEEFTIVIKGKNANQSMQYLNKIRSTIENYDMVIRNHQQRPIIEPNFRLKISKPVDQPTVNITVSIGVADSQNLLSTEEVIKAADKALYRAKSSGRNRVTNLRFA